jgi:hypothetical protein
MLTRYYEEKGGSAYRDMALSVADGSYNPRM